MLPKKKTVFIYKNYIRKLKEEDDYFRVSSSLGWTTQKDAVSEKKKVYKNIKPVVAWKKK